MFVRRSKINDAQSPLRRTTSRNRREFFIRTASHAHFDRSAVTRYRLTTPEMQECHTRQRFSNMQTTRMWSLVSGDEHEFRNEFWRSYFYRVSRMIPNNRESRFKNWFYRWIAFYAFARFPIHATCWSNARIATTCTYTIQLGERPWGRELSKSILFGVNRTRRVSSFLSSLFSAVTWKFDAFYPELSVLSYSVFVNLLY